MENPIKMDDLGVSLFWKHPNGKLCTKEPFATNKELSFSYAAVRSFNFARSSCGKKAMQHHPMGKLQ